MRARLRSDDESQGWDKWVEGVGLGIQNSRWIVFGFLVGSVSIRLSVSWGGGHGVSFAALSLTLGRANRRIDALDVWIVTPKIFNVGLGRLHLGLCDIQSSLALFGDGGVGTSLQVLDGRVSECGVNPFGQS